MAKTRTRCYSIEVRDTKGSVLFSTVADWGDKERSLAIAQIMRLAALPEVNFYAKPALAPQSGKGKAGRRSARPGR